MPTLEEEARTNAGRASKTAASLYALKNLAEINPERMGSIPNGKNFLPYELFEGRSESMSLNPDRNRNNLKAVQIADLIYSNCPLTPGATILQPPHPTAKKRDIPPEALDYVR